MFYLPRIAPLLVPTSDLPTGGAETQIFLLAKALAKGGARVCLITFPVSDRPMPAQVDGIDLIVRKPYGPKGQRLRKLREIVEIWRTLGRVDARVFVQRMTSFETGVVGVVAKLRRRPFVYSSASVIDFDVKGFMPDHHRDIALFTLGIRLADTIVVQTPEQVDMCVESYGRGPLLIKSLSELPPDAREQREAFLWVGRAVWYKDPLAYVELARSVPEATFWMILVPSAKSELEQEVLSAAADLPNLEVLSPRPRNELLGLYDRALAVVSTSIHEGMPNVFLEAWARGVPVLSLRCDPGATLSRDGLGLWADDSPQELARDARELWAERTEADRFSERCREYIAREHGSEVIAAWRSVLGIEAPAPVSPKPQAVR
ncbi:MAG: glycosyltransferase family 4 protein [Solirubrobacteraceae bacterium]